MADENHQKLQYFGNDVGYVLLKLSISQTEGQTFLNADDLAALGPLGINKQLCPCKHIYVKT